MAPDEPYAPPADSGATRGAHTAPTDTWAEPNPQDPEDRSSAGSLWTGVKQQRRKRRSVPNGHVWRAQALILLMVLLFGGLAVLGGYCGAPAEPQAVQSTLRLNTRATSKSVDE